MSDNSELARILQDLQDIDKYELIGKQKEKAKVPGNQSTVMEKREEQQEREHGPENREQRKAIARARATTREINRIKIINGAFDDLRNKLPVQVGEPKLSKIVTLKKAINYIAQLKEELHNTPLHSSSDQSIMLDSDAQLVPGLGPYSVSQSASSTSQESTSDGLPQNFKIMPTEGHMWYYPQPPHF
ncbi:Protein CBG10608 [Caenorhabditis briggsae]|uniref:BHLH domain-containing protein n=2 Tax=Caenorhabditis briggsae TaxID=6238 RepID=A0AAE8ZXV5_CAEBR|nr:Protein CBG10608 [Caenorhabditis briggsae]ULT85324.1 hypothetical protein L3Y34_013851 [Caenorhabditis briggsae]CAP29979.1 Protein CBG10608 [Caenorhabditis briggsae]